MLSKITFYTLLLFTTSFLYSVSALSQETECTINYSSNISSKQKSKKRTSTSNLKIPFFDDFAHYQHGLADSLWINKGAFVNNSYCTKPLTIGVVTLDALDNDGKIWSQLSSNSTLADTLISNPIKLDFLPIDSLYLSFAYQPQGNGDNPEDTDSLYVEFLDIELNKWDRVWSKKGSKSNDFEIAMIPIKLTKYLKEGFQFKIGNYASLPKSNAEPNLKSNVDHWNIDLVYLNKNRNYRDTLINDLAISAEVDTIMHSYTTVPVNHLNNSTKNTLFNNTFKLNLFYNNLSNTTISARRFTTITDIKNNSVSEFDGGWTYVYPKEKIEYKNSYNYDFVRNTTDSSTFELKTFIQRFVPPGSEMERRLLLNDTIKKIIKFKNEYGYDDGTAESGYGLKGNNILNATVALKFNTLQKDTISAVSFYFNNINKQPREDRFNLMIWSDINGLPGDILYESSSELTPDDNTGLSKFAKYELDRIVIVEGTFFVGWKQKYENFLNVGFDVSNIQKDKTFNNFGSGWVNSNIDGVCMIRVAFDKAPTTSDPTGICTRNIQKFIVYPNPTSGLINIKIPSDIDPYIVKSFGVYDISGRLLITKFFNYESAIDITSVPQGVYFIRTFDQNDNIIGQSKIIKK